MSHTDLGTVIAMRDLRYRDPENGSRAVQVLLGMPRESEPGREWCCPWQIIGIGDEKVRAAYGVDAFQCLQLVMIVIGATLYARAGDETRLSWEGQQGDVGFPKQ
jgi:hypothetical protein